MKPKAPRWLTEAFAVGVVEQTALRPSPGAGRTDIWDCWLAPHDPRHRPCSGRCLERFHFVNRQRVENALGALLPSPPEVFHRGEVEPDRRVLILLAAWDPRNGGIACEGHHRRLDSHATPELIVPHQTLPEHVIEFAADWGLESEIERRFPHRNSESLKEKAVAR